MASGNVTRTFRVELEFDGAGFEGWQRQPDARTVQGVLEAALERVLGGARESAGGGAASSHGEGDPETRPWTVVGCGRTDAGVHAQQFVASFRSGHRMDAPELERALDAVLPWDVGVRRLVEAERSFHAQRDADWKWYRYTVLVSRRKRPLIDARAWRLARVPALERLARAASALEGTHDFASFANTGSSPGRTTVRTLLGVRWTADGDRLQLDVVGDGFLYKMVRTLVGTMLEVAEQPAPEREIERILAGRDRRKAGRAAPSRGLCLMAVGIRGESRPSWVPSFPDPDVESGPRHNRGGSV